MGLFSFRGLSQTAKIFKGGILAALLLFFYILSFSLFEDVPADEIVVNQVPVSGELQFWVNPGLKAQMFGSTTQYQKSVQIWFTEKENQGSETDDEIQVLFNDGGNGYISGSIRLLLPNDPKHLRLIHTTFGSMDNLITELVKPTVTKVVFATGPLMNSYESYASKRTDFIRFIEDQLRNGVYRTVSTEQRTQDEFTGKDKLVKVADLVKDPKSPGGLARQEEAPFAKFGLNIAAVSIERIRYEDAIMKQIAAQQKAQMEVQTAIAETKKQEQQLIQAEKEGEKNATVAKWEQEVIKAKMITQAEQQREVARLEKEAAEYTKQKEILLGQGESERKRLIMNADGQLSMKLATYEKVQQMWADAVSKYQGNWVPTTVFGQTGATGMNGAQTFMDIMTMQAARDLQFDPKPTK